MANQSPDAASLLEYEAAPTRGTGGFTGKCVFWLGVALSLAHIYFNSVGTLSTLWQSAWHYGGLGLMGALIYPAWRVRNAKMQRLVLAMDIAMGVLLAVGAIYLASQETAIYDRGVRLIPLNWIVGLFVIGTAIELTRRTTGWIIPALILIGLSYVTWWGAHIGGVFKFSGLLPQTVLFRSIYGDEAMFGTIARISSTVVFMFILFGAFLVRSGAGEFIIDLARSVAGRFVGGPGLVAVLASGLTGTISGSPVGNTMSTGAITIPLMKKSGFPAKFAAGVEASASTGGQLMPPIMGAGAFVMANFTQIPYLKIVSISFLPAVLYFLSVAFFVRIYAKRLGLRGVDDDAPRIGTILRRGGPAFLMPIALLITLLIIGFTPTFAASYAIIAVVVASWLTPNKMGPKAILEALALGARNMVPIGVLLVAIGLAVNVIVTTGVGNTLSLMISQWADGNLLIAIVLVALASLILGMGLPVTASYIVMASLSAPMLFEMIANAQLLEVVASGNLAEEAKAIFLLVAPDKLAALGAPMAVGEAQGLLDLVPLDFRRTLLELALNPETLITILLSAHMIVFWLSQDSNVTPPVCLAAFGAAAIAGTPPMATGLTAWKVAKGLYIIPLLFAYTPFLSGKFDEAVPIFLFGALGVYALAGCLEGHLEAPLGWITRAILLATGVLLIWPVGLVLQGAAAIMFLAIFVWNKRQDRALAAA